MTTKKIDYDRIVKVKRGTDIFLRKSFDPSRQIDYEFAIAGFKLYGVKISTHFDGKGNPTGSCAFADIKGKFIHF